MTPTTLFPGHLTKILGFWDDCLPSGQLETLLEVTTIVGVALSLIGIIATVITLLLFK